MNFYEKFRKELSECVIELDSKIGHLRGHALIKKLHSIIADLGAKNDLNSKIQCGKQACSYCCHSLIAVAPPEAEYIRANAKYTIDKDLQKKQRETDYSKLSFSDKMCIMLKNGQCQIYEHRPMLCRNHNIALGEDPMDCLKQNSLKTPTPTSDVKIVMAEAANIYIMNKTLNMPFKNIADYDW